MSEQVIYFMNVQSYPHACIHNHMQDECNNTALHAASSGGHVEVMTILVQRGANVNALNKVCKSIYFLNIMCHNFNEVHICMYM